MNLISLRCFSWNLILPVSLTYANFSLTPLRWGLDFSLDSFFPEWKKYSRFLRCNINRPQRSAFSLHILKGLPLPSPSCSQSIPPVPFCSGVGQTDSDKRDHLIVEWLKQRHFYKNSPKKIIIICKFPQVKCPLLQTMSFTFQACSNN